MKTNHIDCRDSLAGIAGGGTRAVAERLLGRRGRKFLVGEL